MSKVTTPDVIYGELFFAVQSGHVFADSKTFVDSIPKGDPDTILQNWLRDRQREDFDLAAFVTENFELPRLVEEDFEADRRRPVREHIEQLWDVLQREADVDARESSLIALPEPYIVPGGRFREIYYWDSYFTMLGLAAAGRVETMECMIANFAFLIDQVGLIPNGNRSYYCSRSQPPFFALMVELLAQTRQDEQIYVRYLPQLQREYAFWMERRVVRVGDVCLNRYWDDSALPRQESYAEDVELAASTTRDPAELYRDIRAAAESGWDFSSRWFEDSHDMTSICTSMVVPVDLNALLYKLECTLARGFALAKNSPRQVFFQDRAEARKTLLQTLFFDEEKGFFVDLMLPDLKASSTLSVAAAYPLFFNIATPEQASLVRDRLRSDHLKSGGWVTSTEYTVQQWDAPNGWAPMQWVIYVGLCNYGYEVDAREGANRWVDNNLSVYQQSGNLLEKYDVEHIGVLAGGGEYDVQNGFGWTNGVLLNFLDALAR